MKRWRDWNGSLREVRELYNQMSPEARQRLHAYLEVAAQPNYSKTYKEKDHGIYAART
jgi:uncharacterized protein YeaC (DUF1315 family)